MSEKIRTMNSNKILGIKLRSKKIIKKKIHLIAYKLASQIKELIYKLFNSLTKHN